MTKLAGGSTPPGPAGEPSDGSAIDAENAGRQPVTDGEGQRRSSLRSRLLRIAGIVIAIVAVGFCVRILVREWSNIVDSLAEANLLQLSIAFLLGALGMWLLAVLWWRCLAVFGQRRGLGEVSKWYFAGELGKYLPGGVWSVVGRGELARRDGVPRAVAYPTTVFSLGLMCVGGAIACGLMVPFFALDGGRFGPEMLLMLLIPIGVVVVHPAIFGRLLAIGKRLSRGRLDLPAPSWTSMLGLIAVAVPPWLMVGGASVLIAESLGLDQQPARVAFAATMAWIIGFLAVPVPAGAGIRELLFVVSCGLASSPATAVAAVARVFLIVVDAVGGATGLALVRRRKNDAREGTETSKETTDG